MSVEELGSTGARPTPPPSVVATTTTSPPNTAPVVPADVLQALLNRGHDAVKAVRPGRWVPQLSSKCAALQRADLRTGNGEVGASDGQPEQYPGGIGLARILAFHEALARRFGRGVILTSPRALGISANSSACQGTPMWITLAIHINFDDARRVLRWCDAQSLPADECGARQISVGGKSSYVGR
jgi:hypothetical protein